MLKYIIVLCGHFLKGVFAMRRKTAALLSAIMLLFLPSCGAQTGNNSENIDDIIIKADEVKFETFTARIDSIGPEYHVTGEFRNPYSQNLFFGESGIIYKIYTGSEVSEGDLICEELIEGLADEIDKQKLITDAAEETYNNLRKAGVKGNELEYARIDYESEKGKYDKLIRKSENTKVYAPCSGTLKVDHNELYAGAEVYSGQYLGEISDSNDKYLCAFVYKQPLKDVNFGSKVRIVQGNVIDAESKVVDIIYKDMGPDFSGYYYVIEIPEGTRFLDFGEIDIIFSVNKKDGVIIVPRMALKQVNGRQYVNVLMDGSSVEIDVETGLLTDNYVEIISGLSGGEEIITN